MSFKKYILHVETYWCGEDNDYAIIADENSDIDNFCQDVAYNNFMEYSGFDEVLNTLFPEQDGIYTEEQIDEANDVEGEYYSWTLEEFDENGESKWEWYELILDESEDKQHNNGSM